VPLAPDDPQTPQQCNPARGNRIVCLVQGSPTTGQAALAVTAIYPQQHLAMPQSMTLAGNAAATFTSPDDAAVLSVQRLSTATPLQLGWDGSTLTATAPPGFGVHARYHPERCLPAAAANVVNCAATGSPPQLLQLVVFDTSTVTTRAARL
jgi:hypothetical protein